MGEENTHIEGETITVDQTTTDQEAPFDRLEERIDALIERYEQLLGEHNRCGVELTRPFFLKEGGFDPAGEGRHPGSGIHHSYQSR